MSAPVTLRRGTRLTPARPRDGAIIPNGLFGMLVFILTEAMFFAGFISAFTIAKATAPVWPPPDQPRLPIEATGFNTAMLLLSGVFLIVAHRAFHRGDRDAMRRPLFAALGFGTFFVVFQGFEWVRLIGQGLTLTSSALGSFFFVIVGMHALHAVGAIALLGYASMRLQRGFLTPSLFGAAEAFWFFVVGVWPVIYGVVYL
jgi:cytochrome c oxidase subunit 3